MTAPARETAVTKKILVIEDDSTTADYIAKGFEQNGYVVDVASDGRDGLFHATEGIYAAIVLDRMLPGMDGLALLGALRGAGIDTPVIVLSALGSTDERVRGLKSGSDDYLAKPFAFSELLARVEALQRRGPSGKQPIVTSLRCADLSMDLLARRVERGGGRVDLQPREFKLLELLLRNKGQVVTRTMMLEEVWDYHFDPGTNVIDVHISRLRKKIDEGGAIPLLHTVRGVGLYDERERLSGRTGMRLRLPAPIRVALISVAFSLVITVPVLLFVYHQTDSLFEDRIHDRLNDNERDAMFVYASSGLAALPDAIDQSIRTGELRGGVALLVDQRGHKLAGNLAGWPPILAAPSEWNEIRLFPEGQIRPDLFAIRTRALPGGQRLLIGTAISERERMRAALVEALLGALLLALPLGLIGGWAVLKAAERRARAIGNVAARIAAGDFSHRLDAETGGDEFALLAAAINAMLERIEELVEQLRLVTNSLAHDLRSPLTRMRANMERATSERSQRTPAAGAGSGFARHRPNASNDLGDLGDQQH